MAERMGQGRFSRALTYKELQALDSLWIVGYEVDAKTYEEFKSEATALVQEHGGKFYIGNNNRAAMATCDKWFSRGIYQVPCEREARFRVTKLIRYHGGTTEQHTFNTCQYCVRPYSKLRKDVDAGRIINPGDLLGYPKIERIRHL